MGYLTTLTIYNDGIDLLPDHAQKFSEGVFDASRTATMNRCSVDVGVGNFCNLVKVQVPRHADDHTVYVHMGNTVCVMSAYNEETEELMRRSPEFFEKMLNFMESQVKALRDQFNKDNKND